MTNELRQPNEVDLHVGQRLRARRRQIGMVQEGLASALGLTFQQVQKYERGANRISASKLYDAARALGVPVSYFFEGLPDPTDTAAAKISANDPCQALATMDLGPELARALLATDRGGRAILLQTAERFANSSAKAAG